MTSCRTCDGIYNRNQSYSTSTPFQFGLISQPRGLHWLYHQHWAGRRPNYLQWCSWKVLSCPFHVLVFSVSQICWCKARLKKRSTVIQWSWTCLHPEPKWYRIHFKSHPPSWHRWRPSAVRPLTTQICVLYEDHRDTIADSSHVCSDKLRLPTRSSRWCWQRLSRRGQIIWSSMQVSENHQPPTTNWWSDDMSKFPVPSAAPSKCHTGEVFLGVPSSGTLVGWKKSSWIHLWTRHDMSSPEKILCKLVGNSWWSGMKNKSLEGNTNFLAKSAQWNPDVNQILRLKLTDILFYLFLSRDLTTWTSLKYRTYRTS